MTSVIERYSECAVRDLRPKRIVLPEVGQGRHRELALFCKCTARAYCLREGFVALTHQVRPFKRGITVINCR